MVLRQNGGGGGGGQLSLTEVRGVTVENRPPTRRDHKNKTEPYVGIR